MLYRVRQIVPDLKKKCRCPACPPYDTFWTRPSGTYQR